MAKVGRNQPCPCGSGIKYKRCCIDNDGSLRKKELPRELPHAVMKKIREMEAKRAQREKQQGLGRGIVSAEMNGYRIVCVGNRVLYSKSWKTFHDFLRDYLINWLGKEWFESELTKTGDQRHPIVSWYQQ